MCPDRSSLGRRPAADGSILPKPLSHFAASTKRYSLHKLAYQPTVDGFLPEILPIRDALRELPRSRLSNPWQIEEATFATGY